MSANKIRRKKVVKQLSGVTAALNLRSMTVFEYKAVKVAQDIADKLNEAFLDSWRISQTFTFDVPSGLNAFAMGYAPDNNVVVILEREKRG